MKERICYWCDGSGILGLDMNGNDINCHICKGIGKITNTIENRKVTK